VWGFVCSKLQRFPLQYGAKLCFVMSGAVLAQLSYLLIFNELIFKVKFGSHPGNITTYNFHTGLFMQDVNRRDPWEFSDHS
jgi:hypothetical protein